MFPFLTEFIEAVIGSMLLLPLVVILCAFFFEDATTIIVGLLAADGFIGIPVALISLYLGIVLGDGVLYSLGRLARTHPRLASYIDHDLVAPLKFWLENRYPLTIFSGHFVPGMRFTTYIASGFFRLPFSVFACMAVASSLVWATTLFSISYWFGNLTAGGGPVRWGVAAVFILVLIIAARHNLAAYRAHKNSAGPTL